MKVYKDTQFRLQSEGELSWEVVSWAEIGDLKNEQELHNSKERK